MHKGGRGRSHSIPSALGFQHTAQGSHPSYGRASHSLFSSELGELKEILRNQQEQLNQLTKSPAGLNIAPRTQQNHHQKTHL